MKARIAPDRPQNAVLDIIETEWFSLHFDQLPAPWSDGE
jgi:hypothetical protein